MRRIFVCTAAVTACIVACTAQSILAQNPTVLPDGKITFQISAPRASDVQVVLGNNNDEASHTYPMTKGEKGAWSATVGPVAPEIYRYRFVIDGATVNDSTMEVPGPSPLFYDRQRVPHGTVTSHIYFSEVQQRERGVSVYMPPQYYSEPNRKFPVLYFGAGKGYDFSAPLGIGLDSDIMDNLIAEKKAVPMIVVIFNDSVPAGVLDNSDASRAILAKEFPADTIPFVEKTYPRALRGRNNRAISGDSDLGSVAFVVTMANLDKFTWIGEASSAIFGGCLTCGQVARPAAWDPDKDDPGMFKALASPSTKLNLLYLCNGTADDRRTFTEKAVESFHQHGITVTYKAYPGGHGSEVYIPFEADFVSLLFKGQ